MIAEYPLEDRRYDQSDYTSFWSAAAALDLPLATHGDAAAVQDPRSRPQDIARREQPRDQVNLADGKSLLGALFVHQRAQSQPLPIGESLPIILGMGLA